MRLILIFIFSIPLLFADNQLYLKGKKVYFSKGCSGCHGISASGLGEAPSLKFLSKPYIESKLKMYRKKQGLTQKSQLMIPFAIPLTDKDIDSLSTYLNEFHEKRSTYESDGTGGS